MKKRTADDIKAEIKYHWSGSVAPYYREAESEEMLGFFWGGKMPFRSAFERLDLTSYAELACGHGRHTNIIYNNYDFGHASLLDINESNIERCKARFRGQGKIECFLNSGSDLQPLANESVTSVFSYDAMVHFEYDDVFSYIRDIFRVLKPDGFALLHHSNNDKQPGNLYSDNIHWRNFMSAALFKHVARRTGFEVIDQWVFDWAGATDIDCLTLLRKPAED